MIELGNGTNGQVIKSDGAGSAAWGNAVSGTADRLSYFSSATALGSTSVSYHSTNYAGRTVFDNSTYDEWMIYHESDAFGGSDYSTLGFGNGRTYFRFDAWETQDATHGNNAEMFVYDGLKSNYVGLTMGCFTSSDCYLWLWGAKNLVSYADKHTWWNFGGDKSMLRLDTNTTANETRMEICLNNNTFHRVSVGAADSGGAGYRCLRIAN
jgi:hypothetical protein